MAKRRLTFIDAVRLLGGDSNAVGRINKLAGGAVAATAVATVGDVDFFALRNEIAMWGSSAIRGIRERTQELNRFDRTQRLVAAHAVIVVTSFYQALDEVVADRPGVDLSRAELTREEQVALATGGAPARSYAEMVASLVETSPPMPTPHQPFESTLVALRDHYDAVGDRLHRFLYGLRAFEHPDAREGIWGLAGQVPELAVRRYAENYRALAVQAPEFGVWNGLVDGQATRAALADAIASLRAELARARHVTADGVRDGLGEMYQNRLNRPILSTTDAPRHVTLPTLRTAYIRPTGLVAVAGPADHPAAETWWEDRASVPDVPGFLLGHLTSPAAVEQPIMVLGQPGSGKSLLTEVLSAELPQNQFLPVRVELRKVRADASVQQQIEQALYQVLGETVTWPDLVRSASPALPVIIMDGFDELLQATGVNRADYLESLSDFQQREADLGRPVAVMVTSRTVVADRARCPQATVVVRLEPFAEEQVDEWLDVWNAANEHSLRQRGLRPLPGETAFQCMELATQPLLLLLLALYDAGDNALQNTAGTLGRVDLYEQLFADFIAREVAKSGERDGPEQRAQNIEAEWRRLSAVAIAILNRGADVIVEADLNGDIKHLLAPDDLVISQPDSFRRALTPGQLLVGRFFFIHESKAIRDTDVQERSFEFLHATFGEFLAARQIVAALVELAEDRDRRRPPGAVFDVGFFYAITSFITVARRSPLWDFCHGLLNRLDLRQRQRCRQLVIELLPDAGYPHPTWSTSGYEPRRTPIAARVATYTANLVCFAIMLSDGPVDAAELVGEPVAARWRAQAMLWQSQLDVEDRVRLWQVLRVAWSFTTDPAVLQVRVEDGEPVSVYESLPWPPDGLPIAPDRVIFDDVRMPSESAVGRSLRKSAFVQNSQDAREHLYALLPYWRIYGDTTVLPHPEMLISGAGALLELLLDPMTSNGNRDRRSILYGSAAVAGRHVQRLLLNQVVRDAVHLDPGTLKPLISAFQPGTADEATLLEIAMLLSEAAVDDGLTREKFDDSLPPHQLREVVSALLGIDLH
ncbi:hypothetical protein ALI144C_06650 [Actinosynnema sp. ALI-1.44]|uniref:NACHT domain-containing protein n=1 Tax=Actinosynnema sp. ALI-1.44 TaxID=1933779 RepID=UPI00097C7DC6|nr:NACHT domain-containing protein [Actinosynnema sp. ALI-1.44]ONI88693.1 hypothetical protein ALI144C_06650 [Actinosynnema sp. ALI-1.44]